MQDGRLRRRRGIINAVVNRYMILVAPNLMEALMDQQRDPLEIVGEIVGNMGPDEIVLTIEHFEVR